MDLTTLRTSSQLCAEIPWLRPGRLREWMFHRQTNGLDAAVVKLGRTVLIDRVRFGQWCQEHFEVGSSLPKDGDNS
jgi:hypothetical protein